MSNKTQWFAIDTQSFDEIRLVARWLFSDRQATSESRRLVANMLQRVVENARCVPGVCAGHIDEDEHDRPTVKYKTSEKIALDLECDAINGDWESKDGESAKAASTLF